MKKSLGIILLLYYLNIEMFDEFNYCAWVSLG